MGKVDRPKAGRRGIAALAAVLGLAVSTALAIGVLRSDRRGGAGAGGDRPAPVVLSRESIPAALTQMRWSDVAATAEALAADSALLALAIPETARSSHPPAQYLGALLHLARGEAEAALRIFGAIPPEQLPPDLLYAPDRLHRTLHPDEPGPWSALLLKASSERRLPALIAARVEAQEGQFPKALEDYLRSDPARWTDHDVTLLAAMLQHAGVATEAARLIGGAIRAGRLPPGIQEDLARVLDRAGTGQAAADGARRLNAYLEQNPAARAAALRAATNQLEVRNAFLGRRYGEFLGRFGSVDPMSLPDETVLLLVLSSARGGDRTAFDRWSQELRRRTPTPVVAQWIRDIKADIR